MERRCPACFSTMTVVRGEGIEIDACPSCGGLWFDSGELAKLSQGRPGLLASLEQASSPDLFAPPGAAAPGHRSCPGCSVPLREFEYPWAPGIRLDGCAQCRGVWVD